MRASLRSSGLALSVLLSTGAASAHFTLISPKPNTTSTDGGKGAPPCGPTGPSSGMLNEYTGGQEIDLIVDEYVNHGGFYRIALAVNSPSELPVDNIVYDSANKILPANGMPTGTSDHADWEMNPKFPVLLDHLFAHEQSAAAKKYMGKLTLPNVTCSKCTLQVIQFMAPHGYNGNPPNGGGYFYHHCADLKITADPGKPVFDPNAPAGGSGGTAGGGAGGTGGSGGASGGAGGVATGGTGGAPAGGTASAGAPSGGASGSTASAGTATTGGSAASGGAGGAAPAAPAADDGGCSMGRPSRGAFSLLAALGLGLALVRRRKTSR